MKLKRVKTGRRANGTKPFFFGRRRVEAVPVDRRGRKFQFMIDGRRRIVTADQLRPV